VLLIPLTTQLDALRFPGTVLVEPDTENGLRRPSVALTFQLSALDQRFVGTQLGHVSQEAMQAVWVAFDDITERQTG
jgi:mRNA-degrading endonuclease toxin of MazEF toxin-antitoxin module